MKTRKYQLLFSLILMLFAFGCEDLEVLNENDPDFATAFSNPNDIKGVAGSLINSWFMAAHDEDGGWSPAIALLMAADAGTCSWGNFGMRAFSNEPRIPFDNTPAYTDATISEMFYKNMYGILSSANEILAKTEIEGIEIPNDDGGDDAKMVSAVAHLAQGMSLGYIGLIFNQGFVTSENTNLSIAVPLSPYKDVIDSALSCLDKAIAICESETFSIPSTWVPGIVLDQKTLGELANSFAARIMAYAPRNEAENDAVDWDAVYAYAKKGITYDFSPLADDISWYSLYQTYPIYGGWGQTDMRIINMMDPAMPAKWPEGGFDALPAHKEVIGAGYDNRIVTDYEYLESCPFRAERGYYHFSCYRFSRLDTYLSTWTEPMPEMYKSENDLLIAEAALKTGKLAEAADIINAGTRVTRGGLAPVAANETAIEDAIFYERNVELMNSGACVQWFTMRKADKLQSGSILHFPLPGQQLEVNAMDYYTFGPDLGEPGIDYSTGGWF